MAVTVASFPQLVALLAVSVLVFTLPCPSGSIHFKMFHKFSRHSPSFPGNLTDMEMTRLLLSHDDLRDEGNRYRHRELKLPRVAEASRTSSIMRPRMRLSPVHANYLLEIDIGTPPTRHILKFDTSSAITWLQCLPCWHCFTNPGPIYNPDNSSSWHVNTCLPDEKHCYDDVTTYNITYPGGSSAFGLEYYETMWFPAGGSKELEPIDQDVPFLCAKQQRGFGSAPAFEGVAAFGYVPDYWPLTFSDGKFSYCLRNESAVHAKPGRLRLGDEAVLSGPGVKRVPFLLSDDSTFYYLGLTDVSVAGRRIGFKPGTFLRPKGPGFYIDSGTSFTRFASGGPYKTVVAAFKAYFAGFGLKRITYKKFLCYEYKKGFSSYPNMTFHFENKVDFVVPSRNVVKVFEERHFCVLLSKGLGDANIWGAVQQRDYRISYDVSASELAFVLADCDQVL